MQIDRLFGITHVLLNEKRSTAKELADRFGVSQRTIYRDIDILSLAGIPIYTNKGKGGGIRLLDEFVLEKSVFNEKEQNEILSALQGLRVANIEETEPILQKLGSFWNCNVPNWLDVDFSYWGCSDNEYFNQLKTSILNRNIIEFDYYNSNCEKSHRRIEPIQLWFKHRSWYLKGFCLCKKGIRVFKLTRMKNLIVTDEFFDEHDLSTGVFKETSKNESKPNATIKLKIAPEMAYRVYDYFDENQIIKSTDGSFIVETTWAEDEWVYSVILSFGEYAEVLSPERIKRIISEKLFRAFQKYL